MNLTVTQIKKHVSQMIDEYAYQGVRNKGLKILLRYIQDNEQKHEHDPASLHPEEVYGRGCELITPDDHSLETLKNDYTPGRQQHEADRATTGKKGYSNPSTINHDCNPREESIVNTTAGGLNFLREREDVPEDIECEVGVSLLLVTITGCINFLLQRERDRT